MKQNKKVCIASIISLTIQLIPIILIGLSNFYFNIYNNTDLEKYEGISVALEDAAISLILCVPFGTALSYRIHRVNPENKFSKVIMLISLSIFVVLLLYIVYKIFFTGPVWNP